MTRYVYGMRGAGWVYGKFRFEMTALIRGDRGPNGRRGQARRCVACRRGTIRLC
jgi:hypothetical protein